jgi:small subunit ribosomal protein S5|tara:strand:- start:1433 stop:2371 length:939 start_codon:yes stop_codon:yes gene_type:complete
MAENKNKDKELQKTDKDDSLKSIKTSKPVSKNTKPSSEFKKSKETKSIDSKSVVSKNVDSKESKKNISQNNKDKSPKNSDGKETKNDSNNDEKNIHQKKSESSLKVEKNKISLKNGNSKDIKRAAPGDSNSDSQNKTSEQNEYIEKLVSINRVAKVVKGGRRFSFAALVVVGDGNGMVGHGKGKAKEVPEAIKKATDEAKAKMIRVPLRHGRTLHHDIRGRFDSGKVYLRSAPSGTGVIAGGPMRAVFEALGIQDIVAKSVGSSNPHNMVRATFEALKMVSSPKIIAMRRGLKVNDITKRRKNSELTENVKN